MKIKLLTATTNDLIEGYHFYEQQSEGIGTCYLDSLYTDIDS